MSTPFLSMKPSQPERGLTLRLVAAMLSAACTCMAADVSPKSAPKPEDHALPLPKWSEQELQIFRDQLLLPSSPGVLPSAGDGSGIDSDELLHAPLAGGSRLNHLFDSESKELTPRLQTEDMRLFLPESLLGQSQQDQPAAAYLPTPLSSLRNVSQEFLAACEQSLPREYLIDPDQLVPEVQNHDMTRLLEFHAHDARIKLYVLVTAHDQKLPEGASLDKLASGSLLLTDACLLVYPQGEPWRTRLFVSRSIHSQVSGSFLSDTIQACLKEALQTSNIHDQLRRYTIHLSTRLFWLQKSLSTEPSAQGKEQHTLAEFSPEAKNEPAQSKVPSLLLPVWSLTGLLVAAAAFMAGRRIHHSLQLRRRRRIWMLEEPETPPRLGGAFTGGGGGMIRYA
jgi:hypothetical protein